MKILQASISIGIRGADKITCEYYYVLVFFGLSAFGLVDGTAAVSFERCSDSTDLLKVKNSFEHARGYPDLTL